MILKGYVFSLLYGAFCLALAFLAYKLGLDKKYTRKIVHILIGFEWVILYHYHSNTIHFLIVCIIFTALVTAAYFSKSMPMISSDSENAAGTVYYCLSITAMSLLSLLCENAMLSFGLAVFCTSLGDGVAGVLGQLLKRFNPRLYNEKTLLGTLSNFSISLITALIFIEIFEVCSDFRYAISIALFSCIIELFVGKGLDNIAVPVGVFSLSLFLLYAENAYSYILPILLTPIIIAVAIKKKWLTNGGLVCAVLLDVLVSVAFENFGFVFILLFLIGGNLTDKLKARKKDISRIDPSKSSRSFMQVFANAFVPAMCSILYLVFDKNKIFLVAFCVSVSEAFADTAASSFGALSKNTLDIFKMKKCEKGISGGVSVYGTAAALITALFMSSIAYLFAELTIIDFIIIALISFIGVFIDTLLGSVFQIKYKCKICNKLTERRICCALPCERSSGIFFVSNELVNLISSAFTVIITFIIYLIKNGAIHF